MKQRPPRKKKRIDLPGAAYQALKKSDKALSLKELYYLIEKSLVDKYHISISALHTELNLDGRFIFLSDKTWALKSQVPHLKRKNYDEIDLLEVEYEPVKEDYKWTKDEEDSADDESELLVPYDGEEIELVDEPEDNDAEDDYDEDEDDYPEY
ncbi:DNA-directed RNA polymerase subunit delta [Clostridium sp. 'deep sea']|uniref:DNA-directed RNA polymerase subunit delta n=1 Tax=Clostridium sp. 'deep sea' TaxID=2779445 RepID=UPI001896740E|nr:DNA-directed RNA polymerase subunit delta [Clostridium sp. 'deep sea']QOR34115.1 DNA-directed RNA polymerase subunit delta [Clostridium sp. 'deep sea']